MPFISTANAAEMSARPCAGLVPIQNRFILDRYYLAGDSIVVLLLAVIDLNLRNNRLGRIEKQRAGYFH